jgi:flagellar biosynthesis/type III secretory pathway chaperone
VAGLMDNLLEILSEQAENYENLLGLSKEKKDVIVSNDVKDLQTITSLENTLLGKHQRLEKKRIEVTKKSITDTKIEHNDY